MLSNRRLGHRLAAASVLAITVAAASAAPALAKSPTGLYALFSQCPRFTAGVSECVNAQTKSGEVVLGKQAVPISNTITLQGGAKINEAGEETFVGALNGQTLSKSPQKVPGGLLDLVKCNEITNPLVRLACELVFENGVTGVNATTELAGSATSVGISKNNLINGEGAALTLPVKIHLENAFLGGNCYIGSNSAPIVWHLTTGTTSPPAPNKPISGAGGELEFPDGLNLIVLKESVIVDNSFAAPEATGCGILDTIIDGKLGIPAASGKNTAILRSTLEDATAEAVIASEK
jgi:hypothetical protein